jgi:hypothetical protein
MIKCDVCKIDFPANLISPLVSGNIPSLESIQNCCPICALGLRNKTAGLPPDTPFQGTIAKKMYGEAVTFLKKKGTSPPKK